MIDKVKVTNSIIGKHLYVGTEACKGCLSNDWDLLHDKVWSCRKCGCVKPAKFTWYIELNPILWPLLALLFSILVFQLSMRLG